MDTYFPIPHSNLQARATVYYSKGSKEAWNRHARGFYLLIQPVELIVINPAGYTLQRANPFQAVKLLLIECQRKTVKGYYEAVKIAEPQIPELIAYIKSNKL